MSNFTDFFPAASGGGGGGGKSITVGDIVYPNAKTVSELKLYKWYRTNDSAGNSFYVLAPGSNHPDIYFGEGSDAGWSSSWNTIVDITSSTNGGGAFVLEAALYGSGGHSNRAEQVRLTVDGTATTFTAITATAYDSVQVFFSGLAPMIAQFNTQDFSGTHYNLDRGAPYGGNYDSWLYDTTTDSYYRGRPSSGNYYITYPSAENLIGLPFLYFESTFKFEVNFGRSDINDRARALVKLF